jgi:hypothetical protein
VTEARTRPPVPVHARVVWERAGEERLDGFAMRWSGWSVFVTPVGVRGAATGRSGYGATRPMSGARNLPGSCSLSSLRGCGVGRGPEMGVDDAGVQQRRVDAAEDEHSVTTLGAAANAA